MKHEHITTALFHNCGEKRQTNSRLTDRTLIHVLVAGTAYEASRTGANGTAVEGVGITNCALVAGVTHTCIIKVAKQTCGDSAERKHMPVINNLAAI